MLSGPATVTDCGDTERVAAPLLNCAIVKVPSICSPEVNSVARMVAGCVVALRFAWMNTNATPLPSETTVSVDTSGVAGLLLWIPKGPATTSNLTCLPGMPTPPGPVTVTEAVPVCPAQMLAPHADEAGLIVSVPKIGAAFTVTVDVAL